MNINTLYRAAELGHTLQKAGVGIIEITAGQAGENLLLNYSVNPALEPMVDDLLNRSASLTVKSVGNGLVSYTVDMK